MASEAYGKWRVEAHKRESLDKILNKFVKKDGTEGGVGLERRKSSRGNKEEDKEKEDDKKEDNKEAGRNQGSSKRSRVETSFKSKRMRPNSANVFRQDVKVNIFFFFKFNF